MDLVRAAALALGTTALVACSPAVTAPPPAAEPSTASEARTGQPQPVTSTVDASLLGPGSTLTVVTRRTSRDVDAGVMGSSLEVIAPDGARHPVYDVTVVDETGYYPGDFTLADWRPELHTALLRVTRGDRVPDKVVSYDLTTGETHEITLPRKAISAGLDPDGTGILMALYHRDARGRLVSRDWDGTTTRLPGTTGGAPMTSPDGRTLVSGAGDARTWWVVDLARRTGTRLVPPGSCDPIRWLDGDSILTSCYAGGGNRLRAMDLDGTSSRLGVFHRVGAGTSGTISDGDVRMLAGTRWYVTWGGCGTGVLRRLTPAGKARAVPGTAGVFAIATHRGRLLLARGDDLCRDTDARGTLERLDPRTGLREVLVRLEPREDWQAVVPATEVWAWNP